jgi:NADPH:quinone reductase-like Zn-dependent oxidoreductase
VEAVGRDVTAYQPGDMVFGTTGFSFGAYAEYICLPAEPGDAQGVLGVKPANLSDEEAAAVPTAGLEALHYLREAQVSPGIKVLVIGGAGSIGTFAIQLARQFGAEVTAVDSTAKLDLMRSLGADHAIDYTKEDITRSGESYDVIIDVVGRRGVSRRLALLKEGGSYFLAYAGLSDLLLSRWTAIKGGKRLRIEAASQAKEDLEYLKGLLERGELRSIIGRTFPLAQVPEAHRYVESGEKMGSVAIRVKPPIE